MKGIIYRATNSYNGKVYIGQTITSLRHRRSEHFRDAASDSINHFHLALMQYGKDAFEWDILDEFSGSLEDVIHALNVAEEYHILKHKSLVDEHGYNATKGGYSSDKFAESIKKRASIIGGAKKVLQYSLEGDFIREYESIAAVASAFGKEKLEGKTFIGRAWKGYQWRLKENEHYPYRISPYKVNKKPTISIVAYKSDGSYHCTYNSYKEAVKNLGKKYRLYDSFEGIHIRSYEKGKYILVRLSSPTDTYPNKIDVEIVYPKVPRKKNSDVGASLSVLQYSPEGKLLAEFSSINEAHRYTGAATSAISRSCRVPLPFKVKHGTKYIWRLKRGEIQDTIEIIPYQPSSQSEYMQKLEHRVVQLGQDGTLIKVWENMYQASLKTGESHGLIRKQCLGIPTKKKTKSIWKPYEAV